MKSPVCIIRQWRPRRLASSPADRDRDLVERDEITDTTEEREETAGDEQPFSDRSIGLASAPPLFPASDIII